MDRVGWLGPELNCAGLQEENINIIIAHCNSKSHMKLTLSLTSGPYSKHKWQCKRKQPTCMERFSVTDTNFYIQYYPLK